MSILETAH